MSTYAVVVCDRGGRRRVQSWLAEHAVPQRDVLETTWRHRAVFVVARDVHRHVAGSRFGIGTAVDYERGRLGFGLVGWQEMGADTLDGLTGEFLEVSWAGPELSVTRDLFGSIPVLHTGGPGWVAVSDSLLLLRDLRTAQGSTTTVNVEAATARTRTLAITHQSMSPETLLDQIGSLPAGRSFHVERRGLGLRMRLGGDSLPVRVARVQDDRAELTRRIAASTVAVVRALADSPCVVPELALSGGVDSRMMLAAVRRAGAQEQVLIQSWNRSAVNEADYACAQQLSRWCGFALNSRAGVDPGDPIRLSEAAIPVFATSHLGLYDRVLPMSGTWHNPRMVQLGGLGAELLKGNYGFRSLPQMAQWLSTGMKDASRHAAARHRAAVAQLAKGLRAIDVDPDAPDASEWHYAAYRAGQHGAAHSPMHLSAVRTLMQLDVLALGHRPDRPGTGVFTRAKGGMLDLLVLLDADLAQQPYANAGIDLSADDVQQRLHQLGGPLTDEEIPSMRIFGKQAAAGGGPHALGASIARAWGLGEDSGQVVELTQPWVDAVADRTLRAIHQDLGNLTRNELKRVSAVGDAGPGPAKRLSTVLLAS